MVEITAQLDTYQFRKIIFGKSMPKKERISSVERASTSFATLAGLLNLSPRAVSMNRQLTLAFGARGHGSSAHYELEYKLVNLTRSSGAGSLAHEWFHALDNHFGGGERMATGIKDAPAEWKKFMSLLRATSFYKRCRASKSRYLKRPDEIAARGFEFYVQSKLKERCLKDDYLVSLEKYWAEKGMYPREDECDVLAPYDFLIESVRDRICSISGAVPPVPERVYYRHTPKNTHNIPESRKVLYNLLGLALSIILIYRLFKFLFM
ncbi:MAG: hypothetical protein HUJ67_07190 [Ruminiclostridium sp.]|nr:hypothetical protein [Ruminiclostridium sp.]